MDVRAFVRYPRTLVQVTRTQMHVNDTPHKESIAGKDSKKRGERSECNRIELNCDRSENRRKATTPRRGVT
jgi:hypothetical protein